MNREEIKESLDRVRRNIAELERQMHRAFKPKGYKSGTSYEDYDTIHGGNKELDFVKISQEHMRLVALRDTYICLLNNSDIEVNEDEVLRNLKGNYEKIRFLRIAQGHTQQYVADKLEISSKTVQRIEQKIKLFDMKMKEMASKTS